MPSPQRAIELEILNAYMETYGPNKTPTPDDLALSESLADWSEKIRKLEATGTISFSISTRRLKFIIESYGIGMPVTKALEVCLGVYDAQTASTLKQMFALIDPVKLKAEAEKAAARAKAAERQSREQAEAQARARQLAAKSPTAAPTPVGNSKEIVLTGTFAHGDRVKCTAYFKSNGYVVKGNLTKSTKILVTGQSPSESKLKRARNDGITIESEAKFIKKMLQNQPTPIPSNARIVLEGDFAMSRSRSVVSRNFEKAGFTVGKALSKNVDVMIIGDRTTYHDAKRRCTAAKHGVQIISETEFIRRMKAASKPQASLESLRAAINAAK